MTAPRKGARAELHAEVEIVERGPDLVTVSIPGVVHRLVVPPEMIREPEPPVGSVVIDRYGDVWQRRHRSGWTLAWGVICGLTWDNLNKEFGPVRVIWTPEDDE